MRFKVLLPLPVATTLVAASCGSNCPTPSCFNGTVDVLYYCVEYKNCTINGQFVTSCIIGGGLNCRLRYLNPQEVMAIPLTGAWNDAGTARDLEITDNGADLRNMVVTVDDKAVSCSGVANDITCKGLDRSGRILKLTQPGPGGAYDLYVWLRDFSCNPPPCPV